MKASLAEGRARSVILEFVGGERHGEGCYLVLVPVKWGVGARVLADDPAPLFLIRQVPGHTIRGMAAGQRHVFLVEALLRRIPAVDELGGEPLRALDISQFLEVPRHAGSRRFRLSQRLLGLGIPAFQHLLRGPLRGVLQLRRRFIETLQAFPFFLFFCGQRALLSNERRADVLYKGVQLVFFALVGFIVPGHLGGKLLRVSCFLEREWHSRFPLICWFIKAL